MTLSEDPWVQKYSVTFDPKMLHALGVITLWWNHCERNLFLIFSIVFRLPRRVAWIIAHDMGDLAISERIRERLKVDPPDAEVATVLDAYLKAHDACRVNRNTLTHFTGSVKPDAPDLSEVVFLRMKGPSGKAYPLPSKLTDIRRVAEEIHIFTIYSWNLMKALRARAEGKPTTLPPPIAAPEPLWKPPPPIAPKPKRLPESSQRSPPEDTFVP
jgi:hypothetical protein